MKSRFDFLKVNNGTKQTKLIFDLFLLSLFFKEDKRDNFHWGYTLGHHSPC
jgi:hypothetical protein